MNIKYLSNFIGIDALHSPRIVEDQYVINCKNVLFRDGTMSRRWGYYKFLGSLPEQTKIRQIVFFDQYETLQYPLIAITENDIFKYNYSSDSWEYVSPIYTTGQASASGTSVTGSGTSWLTVGIKQGDYIKFGTTNPNDGTRPWRMISAVNSNTSLTLVSSASASMGSYVIRRVLGSANIDWTIATKTDGTRYLIVATGSKVLYYDGDTYAQYINCNPAYACGFFGTTSGEHLLLGYVVDTGVNQPNTIEISDVGNPLSWTRGYYIDLYDSNDMIKGFKKIRDYIAVYKEHSISLLSPSYSDMLFDKKENVVSNIGTVSIRTVGSFGNYHIFMSQNNIHVFDGVNIQDIGDYIKPLIYPYLNWDYIHRSFAFSDTINNLYMLFVPINDSEEPNICIVYDLYCKGWTIFEFAHTITAIGDVYVPYQLSWNDLKAKYTGTTYSWDWYKANYTTWQQLKGGARFRATLFGDSRGNFYRWETGYGKDDAYPIRALIETKDYSLNEPYQLANVGDVRLYMKHISEPAYTPRIGVKGSMNYGSEWSEEKLVDMVHPSGVSILDRTVSFALRGNYLRLRIANTANGDDFSIEGMAVIFNDAGV